MSISVYRRWYEHYLNVPCPLSDSELLAYPYFLKNDSLESPLSITSGLLSHGDLNHD